MSDIVVQDLTVRGESIERVYSLYEGRRYQVNRRYQRKLIWTLDEKISFIDSIQRGYPVPIILLAENKTTGDSALEIIDGMQRLNAVVSFLENGYPIDGHFFDLNTMAVTKAAADTGVLIQKTPVLPRDICVRIASYQIPFSIYEFATGESVDDVFRRINSGGKKLSRQELRAAGSTGHFSTVVRRIAAKIRGDDSFSDILRLNEMGLISITNKDLSYGLSIDNIFWVSNGILTKEQVRESRDEELIGDLVAFMVSDPPPSSRSEFLDDFFGLSGVEEASRKRRDDIESAIQRRGADLVIRDFSRALDELIYLLSQSEKSFAGLIFDSPVSRAPRYFQVVFLAFYILVVKRNKVPGDRASLIRKMNGSYKSIKVAEGGAWGAEQRVNAVHAAVGVYENCFVDDKNTDPAVVHWITQLENILGQSYSEQASYDFKQGFLLLDDSHTFDVDSFAKILQTCVGIANIRKGARGYVLVGVADKSATAARVEELYDVRVRPFDRFYITGVEHEAKAMGKNLEQLHQLIIDKIKHSNLSHDLKGHLARNVKSVRYYDLTVYVFDVEAQNDPSNFNGVFYERAGAQLEAVPTTDVVRLVRRYG